MSTLPLFSSAELARETRQCERLAKKLKRGRMDVRSRIRTERKLALAVARRLMLENKLGLGSEARR